ncbi:unnamed protein product [Ectocarpus sp. 13 AM-2016]
MAAFAHVAVAAPPVPWHACPRATAPPPHCFRGCTSLYYLPVEHTETACARCTIKPFRNQHLPTPRPLNTIIMTWRERCRQSSGTDGRGLAALRVVMQNGTCIYTS